MMSFDWLRLLLTFYCYTTVRSETNKVEVSKSVALTRYEKFTEVAGLGIMDGNSRKYHYEINGINYEGSMEFGDYICQATVKRELIKSVTKVERRPNITINNATVSPTRNSIDTASKFVAIYWRCQDGAKCCKHDCCAEEKQTNGFISYVGIITLYLFLWSVMCSWCIFCSDLTATRVDRVAEAPISRRGTPCPTPVPEHSYQRASSTMSGRSTVPPSPMGRTSRLGNTPTLLEPSSALRSAFELPDVNRADSDASITSGRSLAFRVLQRQVEIQSDPSTQNSRPPSRLPMPEIQVEPDALPSISAGIETPRYTAYGGDKESLNQFLSAAAKQLNKLTLPSVGGPDIRRLSPPDLFTTAQRQRHNSSEQQADQSPPPKEPTPVSTPRASSPRPPEMTPPPDDPTQRRKKQKQATAVDKHREPAQLTKIDSEQESLATMTSILSPPDDEIQSGSTPQPRINTMMSPATQRHNRLPPLPATSAFKQRMIEEQEMVVESPDLTAEQSSIFYFS